MKNFNWLILTTLIIISACGIPYNNIDESPIEEDYCNTDYTSFTDQSSTDLALNLSCECQDSMIDLGTALLPFTAVKYIDFNCSEAQFNMIPIMPSVNSLRSSLITMNVADAFPNLKALHLYSPDDFPNDLGTVPLETFFLYYNRISSLPHNLDKLTNLTDLIVSGNIGSEPTLAANLGDLINLKSLDLAYVGNIPSTFNQFTKLETFSYIENALPVSIPPIFDNMDSLKFVNISKTTLSITEQQSLYNATNIKNLAINSYNIVSIAPEIGQLDNVEKLTLLGNFNALPTTIGNLSSLKWFKCSSSSLTEFPSGMSGLNNTLEYLSFTNSNLSTIPTSIRDFEVLETLSFSYNGLTSLPAEIADLSDTLKTLFLAGNNFSDSMKSQIRGWLPNTTIYF